jgi:predicted short-subunit dehydrogenase-like oxidoreductase (DUF2520 family)
MRGMFAVPFGGVQRLKFVVLGPGRMGTALTLALTSLGHSVLAAHGRVPDSRASQQYQSLTGVPVIGWEALAPYVREADVVLLTVPDKAVTVMAETLADEGWIDNGTVMIHTAGSLSAAALQPVESRGALRLCMHPLQTIADPAKGASLFQGVYFTLDGDDDAILLAQQWIEAWGGIPLSIRPDQRPAYHAAAALASNAVVALASVAAQVSGLPDGLKALLPLLHGAVDNLDKLGLPTALTGPVERGDLSTVNAHLSALQHNPTALSVYAALGKATADVARSKESLSQQQWEDFQQLFTSVLGGM